MIVKDINECDFVNYKKPSMFLAFPTCSMKCDELNGAPVCQNCRLAQEPNISISKEEVCERYINNPLTNSIVFGGMEPFDSNLDVISLIDCLRNKYNCNDDVVIYTGYTKEELIQGYRTNQEPEAAKAIKTFWVTLISYPNIIIKFGRFIVNSESRYDDILGVKLASKNQYAEVVSRVK